MSDLDSVRRFDDRVDDYDRHRPGYPAKVAEIVTRAGAAVEGVSVPHADTPGARRPLVVADVGCGTGKLAEILLTAGMRVIGVEPNTSMRASAAHVLGDAPLFAQVAGTAERTGLSDACVDVVTAGQAFHWFDVEAARREFARILRPGGRVVLVWNSRTRRDGHACTPFLREYEALLCRHVDEYARLSSRSHGLENVERFFARGELEPVCLENPQHLDWDTFAGRVRSSSYVPRGGPVFDALLRDVRQSFRMYAVDGRVDASLQTWVFAGHVARID
ncbi:MAG: class I SAM-dependent methyltransferase [Planctomycetes bacterium]|nr:class I SAM-dependent methyltransferase [Planctomycetota bacterium]